jgi:hypothetical protein
MIKPKTMIIKRKIIQILILKQTWNINFKNCKLRITLITILQKNAITLCARLQKQTQNMTSCGCHCTTVKNVPKTGGSHSGVEEDSSLPGYDDVSNGTKTWDA